MGFKGVYITRTCFPDGKLFLWFQSAEFSNKLKSPLKKCTVQCSLNRLVGGRLLSVKLKLQFVEENIMKICPCGILRFFFSAVKNENFIGKILIFLLKTFVVGPHSNVYPQSMVWIKK